MATPPNATTAQAASLADLTALQTAADNAFINDAATLIANATNLGKYFIVLTTTFYNNITNLQSYFRGLGYSVTYLDLPNPNLNPFNPAQLFGEFYFDYWLNTGLPNGVVNPQRIMISWNPPNTTPYPFP